MYKREKRFEVVWRKRGNVNKRRRGEEERGRRRGGRRRGEAKLRGGRTRKEG